MNNKEMLYTLKEKYESEHDILDKKGKELLKSIIDEIMVLECREITKKICQTQQKNQS